MGFLRTITLYNVLGHAIGGPLALGVIALGLFTFLSIPTHIVIYVFGWDIPQFSVQAILQALCFAYAGAAIVCALNAARCQSRGTTNWLMKLPGAVFQCGDGDGIGTLC